MARLVVDGGRTLAGHVVAPADKSIFHRAVMLAALGEGACRVAPLSEGGDNQSTLRVLGQLGVAIDVDAAGGFALVHGVGGPRGFVAPDANLDCGNSGTTMRLMAGLLAASRISATLVGDASLESRPMSRLLPLEKMGALISGRREGGRLYPPIEVRGRALVGCRHDLEISSAQVKTAILLAGLYALGDTIVREPMRSRDHTERLLRRLGVSLVEEADGALRLSPPTEPWRVERLHVAPDLSSAAFMLGASIVTRSSDLVVETGVNPTRTGILDVLARMGTNTVRDVLPDVDGEPVARVRISAENAVLSGCVVEGETTLRAIDEIPLIGALAAFARGTTTIRDARELRVKESDRLAKTRAMLEAFGASCRELDDGLVVEGCGGTLLHPATFDADGDHRMAMASVVMALGIRGTSTIAGSEAIDVSYPGFVSELVRLGARVENARA